jgi:hypothetical protein
MAEILQPDVLEIHRPAVNAVLRRRNPIGELAAIRHQELHALDVLAVGARGEEFLVPRLEFVLRDQVAAGVERRLPVRTHLAVEAHRRQLDAQAAILLLEDLVPARHRTLAVVDVGIAQDRVHRAPHRDLALDQLGTIFVEGRELVVPFAGRRVGVELAVRFVETALESVRKVIGGIARVLVAEQVERHRIPVVDVLLNYVERDAGVGPDVLALVLFHELRRAPNRAREPRLADEQVVRFLGQHEARGARERREGAFGQGAQLVLAVAVGVGRETEEIEPVVDGVVERGEQARRVGVARAALQHIFGFVATVLAEERVEEIHHRPQVARLLDVHLKQVAHVVQRRRRERQPALLLHRAGFGVALGHDQATQLVAMFARDFFPTLVADVVAEMDLAFPLHRRQEYPPAIFRHAHVVVHGPARRVDAHGGAQVDLALLVRDRSLVAPPFEEARVPALEGAQELLVLLQVDVVRYQLLVVHQTLLQSNSGE